jgi:hypothetical protein
MGKKVPYLKVEERCEGGLRKMGTPRPTYKVTVCSECERELHETAKFCVECGAWFAEKRK